MSAVAPIADSPAAVQADHPPGSPQNVEQTRGLGPDGKPPYPAGLFGWCTKGSHWEEVVFGEPDKGFHKNRTNRNRGGISHACKQHFSEFPSQQTPRERDHRGLMAAVPSPPLDAASGSSPPGSALEPAASTRLPQPQDDASVELTLLGASGDLCAIIDRQDKELAALRAAAEASDKRAAQAVEEADQLRTERTELRREIARLKQRLRLVPKRVRTVLEQHGMRVV